MYTFTNIVIKYVTPIYPKMCFTISFIYTYTIVGQNVSLSYNMTSYVLPNRIYIFPTVPY